MTDANIQCILMIAKGILPQAPQMQCKASGDFLSSIFINSDIVDINKYCDIICFNIVTNIYIINKI